jgi:hypothetical protein
MPLPIYRQHPQQNASLHRNDIRLCPLLCDLLAPFATDHLGPHPQAEVVVPRQGLYRAGHRIRSFRLVNHQGRRRRSRLQPAIHLER